MCRSSEKNQSINNHILPNVCAKSCDMVPKTKMIEKPKIEQIYRMLSNLFNERNDPKSLLTYQHTKLRNFLSFYQKKKKIAPKNLMAPAEFQFF